MKFARLIVPAGIALLTAHYTATVPLMAGLKAKVILSKHDVGGTGCKSCHASHNGTLATTDGGNQATGKILAWDRGFSAVTFGVYDSPGMVNKATEVGGALANTDNKMFSLLCMSCHDGVTTPTVINTTTALAARRSATSRTRAA